MLRTIDLTDKEIFLIKTALTCSLADEIEILEAISDTFAKKSLQNSVNELKNLRAKFFELL